MAKTLSSTLQLRTTGVLSNTAGLMSVSGSLVDTITQNISSAQGEHLYTDSVIADTANKTYQIASAGGLLDPFGDTVDIDKIALLVIENTHAAAYLHVSALPAAMVKGTSPVVIIPPGGCFAWSAPIGVVAGTSIVLTGRNAADDANDDGTWKIIAIGITVA
jgi:hypothetical protein